EHRGFFAVFNRVMRRSTSGYQNSLRRALRHRFVALFLFLAGLSLAYGVYRLVPTGFVPDEDQGYFMVLVQAPDGASLDYTSEVTRNVESSLQNLPDIWGVFGVTGFSFVGSAPNRAIVFVTLQPITERRGAAHSAKEPQFLVTIDREKAKSLQVPISQITDALQVFMGSQYVNDFDLNDRSYRVYVQADQNFRSQPKDIGQFYVRSDKGAMLPLES